MQISDQRVACIHYILRDAQGQELERSDRSAPLAYLHGTGSLIPGLEKALAGARAGDQIQVSVPPDQAYGVRDESLIQRLPKRAFKGIRNLRVGMHLQTQGPKGPQSVTVTQLSGDMVTIDANHALAGQTLNFEVEVAEVRAATQEEMLHGHVHGPGGHHH